jgi:hypothetical protein
MFSFLSVVRFLVSGPCGNSLDVKAIAGLEFTSEPLFLSADQSHQVSIFQVAHPIATPSSVQTSLPTGFLDRARPASVLFTRILLSSFSARSVDLVFLGARLLALADTVPQLHFSLFRLPLKSICLTACFVHFCLLPGFFPPLDLLVLQFRFVLPFDFCFDLVGLGSAREVLDEMHVRR